MSQQQTVLRVQTNQPSGIEITSSPVLTFTGTGLGPKNGAGTETSPFICSSTGTTFQVVLTNTGGSAIFNYRLTYVTRMNGSAKVDDLIPLNAYTDENITFNTTHANGFKSGNSSFTYYGTPTIIGSLELYDGDVVTINGGIAMPFVTMEYYIVPTYGADTTQVNTYDTLDLYGDVPIKINKSFAELEDIGKKNSDFSVGLTLPGSKKNNRFFENFFNVDNQTLYFDPTKRVNCDVLLNDQKYFTGYLRLNKVNVLNGKQEYEVTLYSTVADLYGKIGNNLLKDLNFDDADYHFNHYFNLWNVTGPWHHPSILNGKSTPDLYFYPVVHNGYDYSGDTVNFYQPGPVAPTTGDTVNTTDITRLYTSTKVGDWSNYYEWSNLQQTYLEQLTEDIADFRINSIRQPILDNQLKPALNIWGILQLMFKSYGYTIKSEFFKTPWFRLSYLYGYFSSELTKLSYKQSNAEVLPITGVEVILINKSTISYEEICGDYYGTVLTTMNWYVVKKGTGIPVYCDEEITLNFDFEDYNPCDNTTTAYIKTITIPPGVFTTNDSYNSESWSNCTGCPLQKYTVTNKGYNATNSTANLSNNTLAYEPKAPGTIKLIEENEYVNFSQLIDQNYKQIDLLSSIAKKFNLVLVPDPDVANQIIIEPYDFYIGTGNVWDWSDKLSFDKGFSVEPALNYIESNVILSDLEDGDDGNIQFKNRNNRVYGMNRVYNPTDFKSQEKKIETIFSPEVVRKWDSNIDLPLGINYAASSSEVGGSGNVSNAYYYKGIKSKPKMFFNLGNFSPFFKNYNQVYDYSYGTIGQNQQYGTLKGLYTTSAVARILRSNNTSPVNYDLWYADFFQGFYVDASYYVGYPNMSIPVIGHTMPVGNPDNNKKNNDSICNLFNSELPTDLLGVNTAYNSYTKNDTYELFYQNRITNIYNPNTRFLTGNFYLKLSDVQNLQAKDLIKINEQYFIVNKIEGYNLTNTELTKVQLVQTNVEPKTYPTRYFKYKYCGDDNEYKFRTYFNPDENPTTPYAGEKLDSARRSYFYWSLNYDYFVGILGGNGVSGYTSSYESADGLGRYVYTINEITEEEYNGITWDHTNDPNDNLFVNRRQILPKLIKGSSPDVICMSTFPDKWLGFLNVAQTCTAFLTKCSTNFVTVETPPTPI